jgi:hypothetical protein
MNAVQQISHRPEGRNVNEFDDGLREKLDFPPIFRGRKGGIPKK